MFRKIFIAITINLLLCGINIANGAQTKNTVVIMETSLGNVKISLYTKEAPISVKNFLSYEPLAKSFLCCGDIPGKGHH